MYFKAFHSFSKLNFPCPIPLNVTSEDALYEAIEAAIAFNTFSDIKLKRAFQDWLTLESLYNNEFLNKVNSNFECNFNISELGQAGNITLPLKTLVPFLKLNQDKEKHLEESSYFHSYYTLYRNYKLKSNANKLSFEEQVKLLNINPKLESIYISNRTTKITNKGDALKYNISKPHVLLTCNGIEIPFTSLKQASLYNPPSLDNIQDQVKALFSTISFLDRIEVSKLIVEQLDNKLITSRELLNLCLPYNNNLRLINGFKKPYCIPAEVTDRYKVVITPLFIKDACHHEYYTFNDTTNQLYFDRILL